MSSTDHLANAREYIAQGDEFYAKAASEIMAAKSDRPELTWVEIGRQLGRDESWVRKLVEAFRKAEAPPTHPFAREEGETERRKHNDAKAVLRDPVQRERVISGLSDREREQIVDTAIHVTAQEATAKAREHQTEPTLADTGPIQDRTEYEIDVPLTKAWRWARVAASIIETRGVWVGDDRFDEMLQRTQELESAAAQIRAALHEAISERSLA